MIHSLDPGKRRDQWRKMISGIIGEKIEIHFAGELALRVSPDVAAFFTSGLSGLAQQLKPDSYVEPRKSIVICSTFEGLDQWEAAFTLDALLIHEAAHCAVSDMKPLDSESEAVTAMVQTSWRQWPAHTGSAWNGHDARYIRSLIHIAHRVQNRGSIGSLPMAFNHKLYGLSAAEKYAEALGDECRSKDWLPLNEVLAKKMPDEFVKLWMSDVAHSRKVVPVSKGQM